MKPAVSIVIPAHGQVGLTRRCVQTLLGQRPRTSWELLVVDDASPEDLGDALRVEDDRVRVIRCEERGGFARACNTGARSTRGGLLVFLNNDTLPREGWLDALVDRAREHRRAGIVGSRLLYPDGSIQHAGVVICQDRYPRHVYAGFPGDHPAVTRPRRCQAVTAASMLVRREVFEALGGFDTGYTNGLEDADLCLRANRLGHEIHYAPDSVVVHLESVSPGRFAHDRENARLWMERWGERIRADDVDRYREDGLLRFGYGAGYPIRVWLSPQLAVVEGSDGRLEDESMLIERLRWQVTDLLREVARLTARIAEHEGVTTMGGRGKIRGSKALAGNGSGELDGQAGWIEHEILELQKELSQVADFDPSPALEYRALIGRIHETARQAIPRGSTAVVVSRGDERLLEMDGIRCWHFPGDESGRYTGHHPASGGEAIQHLESMRSRGAGYLLIPSTAFWWLDHYRELHTHLEDAYGPPRVSDEACFLYSLEASCRS